MLSGISCCAALQVDFVKYLSNPKYRRGMPFGEARAEIASQTPPQSPCAEGKREQSRRNSRFTPCPRSCCPPRALITAGDQGGGAHPQRARPQAEGQRRRREAPGGQHAAQGAQKTSLISPLITPSLVQIHKSRLGVSVGLKQCLSDAPSAHPRASHNPTPTTQQMYHWVEIKHNTGYMRYLEFDFGAHNRTRLAGLENDMANCYINPLVQARNPNENHLQERNLTDHHPL